jgi:hypothetical protein
MNIPPQGTVATTTSVPLNASASLCATQPNCAYNVSWGGGGVFLMTGRRGGSQGTGRRKRQSLVATRGDAHAAPRHSDTLPACHAPLTLNWQWTITCDDGQKVTKFGMKADVVIGASGDLKPPPTGSKPTVCNVSLTVTDNTPAAAPARRRLLAGPGALQQVSASITSTLTSERLGARRALHAAGPCALALWRWPAAMSVFTAPLQRLLTAKWGWAAVD